MEIFPAAEVCKYSVGVVNEEKRKLIEKEEAIKSYLNYIANVIQEVATKNSTQTRKEDLLYSICFTIPSKYHSVVAEKLKEAGYPVFHSSTCIMIKLELDKYLI